MGVAKVFGWLVLVAAMVYLLYGRSRRWERFMVRQGLSSSPPGSDCDLAAAVRHGEAVRDLRDQHRQRLFVEAPHSPTAAAELRQLLRTEITAMQKTLGEIERNAAVREALPAEVLRESRTRLAELRQMQDQIAKL